VKNNNFLYSILSTLFIFIGVATADSLDCCKALSDDPSTAICPDRDYALLLPRTIPAHSFLFTIEHRANSPAFKNPVRDGLGLDNGLLKIVIGFRYSPLSNLDFGFKRASNALDPFDTYELDARYCFLKESSRYIDACIGTGISIFDQEPATAASGYFAQLILGKSLFGRLYLSSGLIIHTNSTFNSTQKAKTAEDPDQTLCVPLALSARVTKELSLIVESFSPIAGYSAGYTGYSFGVKWATWGHSFSILLSNTQYSTVDGMVTGSDRLNNPVIGFMITRKFGNY